MKRKSTLLKHTITALIVLALIIGFMLLCAACYWRGLVDGRRVYHNKDIACVAQRNKKGNLTGMNCKIVEEEKSKKTIAK